MKIKLSLLSEYDIDQIVLAFKNIGWHKPRSTFETYLLEQEKKIRSVIVAMENNIFCGYVTLKWQSDYLSFKQQSIPEIVDLNVLPDYRKRGIGTQLIAFCENLAKEHNYSYIGLGVGMTADYGNAQRLYIQLGYLPDGHGLFYKNEPVTYNKTVIADDYLVIYLFKSLKRNTAI